MPEALILEFAGGAGAWIEASCPACIGVTLLAERVPGLADLARLDQVSSADPASRGPDGEPKILAR